MYEIVMPKDTSIYKIKELIDNNLKSGEVKKGVLYARNIVDISGYVCFTKESALYPYNNESLYGNIRNKYFIAFTNMRMIIVNMNSEIAKLYWIRSFRYDEINKFIIDDINEITFNFKDRTTYKMVILEESKDYNYENNIVECLEYIMTRVGQGKVSIEDPSQEFFLAWIMIIIQIAIAVFYIISGGILII